MFVVYLAVQVTSKYNDCNTQMVYYTGSGEQQPPQSSSSPGDWEKSISQADIWEDLGNFWGY